MELYPTKTETITIQALDKATLAESIIEQIELGLTKAQLIGIALNGSDDVKTFNEVYNDIVNESKTLKQVSIKKTVITKEKVIAEFDKDGNTIVEPKPQISVIQIKTETEFKASLEEATTYLDATIFYTKLKEAKEVTTWTALKDKLNPEVV